MEDSLWPIMDSLTEEYIEVLILVVMEDSLWRGSGLVTVPAFGS